MSVEYYKGRVFSVLGDSISTLQGYTEPEGAEYYEGMTRLTSGVLLPSDTWWGRVIGELGGSLAVNNSISGSLVARHPDCQIPSYGCSDERICALGKDGNSPDVIMVLLGTNDWGWAMKLYPEQGEQGDISVFSVAYEKMLRKLEETYPRAELWCFTLPINDGAGQGDGLGRRVISRDARDYSAVITECARRAGCRVVELTAPGKPYSTLDGFHPDCGGMAAIADTVLEQIKKQNS